MNTLQIVGRRSSHFTRVALIFAEELGVEYELVPIYDITQSNPALYAGNPALKLPILRRGADVLFGAQNICRAIAEVAHADRITWPETLSDTLSRNAHELVWHSMAAQVQIVFGTVIGKLPQENVYFAKARAGLVGSLDWLEAHLEAVLAAMPAARTLSLFEPTLFCLLEHLVWRKTVSLDAWPKLAQFSSAYSLRPAAVQTAYAFDVPPS